MDVNSHLFIPFLLRGLSPSRNRFHKNFLHSNFPPFHHSKPLTFRCCCHLPRYDLLFQTRQSEPIAHAAPLPLNSLRRFLVLQLIELESIHRLERPRHYHHRLPHQSCIQRTLHRFRKGLQAYCKTGFPVWENFIEFFIWVSAGKSFLWTQSTIPWFHHFSAWTGTFARCTPGWSCNCTS